MLYQDTLTGMLHEVPDGQVNGFGFAEDPYGVGEAQMVYDGLGNPLGWGFLKRLIKKAVPFATSMLGPYGAIINKALPVVTQALSEAPQFEGLPVPVAYPQPGAVAPLPVSPLPVRRPWPAGWRRPLGPNMGRPHRRLYMRCSVWPGPRGLVPVNAGQVPVPVPVPPPGAPIAVQPVAGRGMRRRGGRGRRR
jgi:hypothetical protein